MLGVVIVILGAVANRCHLGRRHLSRCVEVQAPLKTRGVVVLCTPFLVPREDFGSETSRDAFEDHRH